MLKGKGDGKYMKSFCEYWNLCLYKHKYVKVSFCLKLDSNRFDDYLVTLNFNFISQGVVN